jgi:uncharacterized protein YndB with AHSA1/START domain
VYEYFTRADAIVRSMGDYAVLEPESGGRFILDVRGAAVRGRFLELRRPHRLPISWGYAGSDRLPPGASTIEIRLTAHHGGRRVDLERRNLPADEVLGHTIGWQHYVARLAVAAAGRDAGPVCRTAALRLRRGPSTASQRHLTVGSYSVTVRP